MTPKEIKSFIKLMQKEGVVKLRLPELELELAPHAFIDSSISEAPLVEEKIETENTYTDEEILFWSSPGGIELEKAN